MASQLANSETQIVWCHYVIRQKPAHRVRALSPDQHPAAVSLVETRRIDGKVLHEHIAGLGSIETPPTIVSQTEKCTGLGRVASLL